MLFLRFLNLIIDSFLQNDRGHLSDSGNTTDTEADSLSGTTSSFELKYTFFSSDTSSEKFIFTSKTASGIKAQVWLYPSVENGSGAISPGLLIPLLQRNGRRVLVSTCDHIYDSPLDAHIASIQWFASSSIEFKLVRGAYSDFVVSSYEMTTFKISASALSALGVDEALTLSMPASSSLSLSSSSFCSLSHTCYELVESQVLLFCWK